MSSPPLINPFEQPGTQIEVRDEYYDDVSTILSYQVTISLPSTTSLDMSDVEDNEQVPVNPHLDTGQISLGPYDDFDDNLDEIEPADTTAHSIPICREVSIRQRENLFIAKTEEINRLKSEIQQLRKEKVQNFGNLSEVEDKVGHLRDQNVLLMEQLDTERQRNDELEEALLESKQSAAEIKIKFRDSEAQLEQTKKENRRLVHDLDFSQHDLSEAEKELKQSREEIEKLKSKLRKAKDSLCADSNKLLTIVDEKALLAADLKNLKMNLSVANHELSCKRRENNTLQDQVQELQVARQNLRHEMQSVKGQLTTEVNSLCRQLAAAKEQINTYKLLQTLPDEEHVQHELANIRAKYEELKQLFQMHQVNVSEHVSIRSHRRSRSKVVSSEGESVRTEVLVGDGQPSVAALLRNLQEENKLLKQRIRAAHSISKDS